jgi:hypothetical protein
MPGCTLRATSRTSAGSIRRRAANTSRAWVTVGLLTKAPRLGMLVAMQSCTRRPMASRTLVRLTLKIAASLASTSWVPGGRRCSMMATSSRSKISSELKARLRRGARALRVAVSGVVWRHFVHAVMSRFFTLGCSDGT